MVQAINILLVEGVDAHTMIRSRIRHQARTQSSQAAESRGILGFTFRRTSRGVFVVGVRENQQQEVVISRRSVNFPNINSKIIPISHDQSIAYISIATFMSRTTSEDFNRELAQLQQTINESSRMAGTYHSPSPTQIISTANYR